MNRSLTVRINGSVYTVPFREIVLMENELRKIRLQQVNGEKLFYSTFAQVMEQLDDRFMQCSRSYILNMDHIRAMRQQGQHEVIMDNGRHIPLSKKCFLRAKNIFEDYLERNR